MSTNPASKVKGTKITSKLTFLRKEYGEAMVDRVLESMEPTDRAVLSSVVDLGWYDMPLYDALVNAVVQVAGKGNEHILERIGRYGAEDLSQHAYKVYYRSGDPETVLEKMVPIHESLNDPGEMEIVKRRDRELSVIVTEPQGSKRRCQVARAFYQRSVELCNVQDVVVEMPRCSGTGCDACEFVVRWS